MPVASIHEIKAGDTLAKLAQHHGLTLDELLDANQQITNPNLVLIGQLIKIPTPAPLPMPPKLPGQAQSFNGVHPAPSTISTNRAALVQPPLTNLPGHRKPGIYEQVINQFAVAHNPRYLRNSTDTFCNIFLWDVTRAMGCQIPHWIDPRGHAAAPFQPHAHELNINATVEWMRTEGVPHDAWQLATASQAQDQANLGKVAVALWKNPSGGHGHTAVIRPGQLTDKGPACAQAGGINFNMGHIKDGFHRAQPKYYVHD
ncbi:LysM peptidoglycan-binding domain-containing protein [Hymenobacter chitinivorans]|uniref:LysM domain-containing protein n=1 Tax=Hymenobacter chitinivorans DSM 11115 TaxID=1121954 RepID=A0A2M9AS57_9BACT|nr:LysM domain-containing protein [Hymenobacter chitinivorans]PJJ48529.1 LysM domain-containing protein [Hymenobacter chitinivorans DSM 11115]